MMHLHSSSLSHFPPFPALTKNGGDNNIVSYYIYFHHQNYLQVLNINIYLKMQWIHIQGILSAFVNMMPSFAPNAFVEK